MENVSAAVKTTRPESRRTKHDVNAVQPLFDKLEVEEQDIDMEEIRHVYVPANRLSPLKREWASLYEPLVKQLHLQVQYHSRRKQVLLRNSPQTKDIGALDKGQEFVRAFILGFTIDDALAILRLEDIHIETFRIGDVKELKGAHLSRAIGRLAGKDGKTRLTLENTTRTRIVLEDSKWHILGTYAGVTMAKNAMVALIRGSPAGKVYNKLRRIADRHRTRF
ncbi:hypothetical protein PCE1_004628 [Barthelona sp. PCE]